MLWSKLRVLFKLVWTEGHKSKRIVEITNNYLSLDSVTKSTDYVLEIGLVGLGKKLT